VVLYILHLHPPWRIFSGGGPEFVHVACTLVAARHKATTVEVSILSRDLARLEEEDYRAARPQMALPIFFI
jgi:hypothetical protein